VVVVLPDGSVRQVAPGFEGKLSGVTRLFEALVLLAQQMPFAAVARLAPGAVHHRRARGRGHRGDRRAAAGPRPRTPEQRWRGRRRSM